MQIPSIGRCLFWFSNKSDVPIKNISYVLFHSEGQTKELFILMKRDTKLTALS